jgi:cell division protein FtsW (lipid II flippase)
MIVNYFINTLIIVTLVAAISFVAIYATGPWKVSTLGKATMLWAVAMVIWCVAGLIYSFYGVTSWYPYIRLLAYISASLAMCTMLFMLVRTSRQVNKDQRRDNVSG